VEHARSLLFVPGDRPERFAKAAASGADLVIVDLEDAVPEDGKDAARAHLRAWLEDGHDAVVRVNAPGTPWFEADLEVAARLAAPVMVPKAEEPAVLAETARYLGDRSALIPLVETALGVVRAYEVCSVPGVVRAALGNVDLAVQLGVAHDDRLALAHARSALVAASAAAEVCPPVDGVTTAVRDTETLEEDVAHARRLGFTAKLCIHPAQVPGVAAGFAPSEREREWARSVLATDGELAVVDGHMVDRPVVERARRILADGRG
jgi:citrate lyase subunit beta/citryl-CoA lyase